MQQQTTLIIITHNNIYCIKQTYERLKEYLVRHHSINEIIIVDNSSIDGTKEFLKNYNPLGFKTILFDNELKEKECLITALEQSINENTIIIEPEINHRLTQLDKIIHKLKKSELILPNRFDHRSTKNHVSKKLFSGLFSEAITGYVCKDPTNTFKGFKKSLLQRIILETQNDKYYWEEAIKISRKRGIKISEPPTHYKEKVFYKKKRFNTIKELLRIKKIK